MGKKSGEVLGIHPTSDYVTAADDAENQALIYQHRLRFKMLSMWIRNSLITDEKQKLREYKNLYAHNSQDDASVMFFVIF